MPKKRTQREQDRIDSARSQLYWARQDRADSKRIIKLVEKHLKQMTRDIQAKGRIHTQHERRIEAANRKIQRLEERLKCLIATK